MTTTEMHLENLHFQVCSHHKKMPKKILVNELLLLSNWIAGKQSPLSSWSWVSQGLC